MLETKQSQNNNKHINLAKIFLLSALFFSFFSVFGIYSYKIYSWKWFVMFYVYEALFYFGLRSGHVVIKSNSKDRSTCNFTVTPSGSHILTVACLISIFSFIYFLFLYRNTVTSYVFGSYTVKDFEEGRSAFEKITLLLMQFGGESSFLILSADSTDKYKRLKRLSTFTLFLPGVRALVMGGRFTLAVEFLLLFSIKWPAIKERINFSKIARKQKRLIIIIAICLGVLFSYLFSSRAIYYSALNRISFNAGDMQMKSFWRDLYLSTDGKIDFLCYISDYLGEAPYIFSYFCTYMFPEQVYFGGLMFRSVIQIVHSATGLGPSYRDLAAGIGGGQYSGFAYPLIADYGLIGSIIAAFVIGWIFARIEQTENKSILSKLLYNPLKIICFFAPIYYFYVGRIDYAIFGCVLLGPLCLMRVPYIQKTE